MGSYLLEQKVSFEIRALTGDGIRSLPVTEPKELDKAMDALLCAQAAKEGSIRDRAYAASWQYHIGGNADEV